MRLLFRSGSMVIIRGSRSNWRHVWSRRQFSSPCFSIGSALGHIHAFTTKEAVVFHPPSPPPPPPTAPPRMVIAWYSTDCRACDIIVLSVHSSVCCRCACKLSILFCLLYTQIAECSTLFCCVHPSPASVGVLVN